MLERGTEKAPNADFVAIVYETVRQYILSGVSASKKAQKFSAVHPDAKGEEALKGGALWTVAQLVNLSKDQLRSIDDDMLRTMRRQYMQLIDGTMMGRLRQYLDRIENPDAKRGARSNEKAKPAADAPLLERGKAVLVELTAGLLALKRPDGVAMDGLVQAHDAACELLARLGQVK